MKSSQKQIVLFSILGTSPSVLTETVWALAEQGTPPDRVVVVTTKKGRDLVVEDLLTPRSEFKDQSVWDSMGSALLKKKWIQEPPRFGATADDLRVITGGKTSSQELDDIRSPEDNIILANGLLDHLRQFVYNSDVRLIASIAGGRKTMSALLYSAVSLIGRESDRITHVLVNEPYDLPTTPRFYFPDQPTGPLLWGKKRFLPQKAQIELADLPFVPLRNRFRDLDDLPGSFSSLIHRYSRQIRKDSIEPVQIRLIPRQREIRVDDREGIQLRARAYWVLEYLIDVNQRRMLPASQKEAVEPLIEFVKKRGFYSLNSFTDEDIKRELSYIRQIFSKAEIHWGPRHRSLELPPFRLLPIE